MRRRSSLGNVIQSYKQVKNVAPVSRAAATQVNTIAVLGVDNYSGPTANNYEVPTGAVVKEIDIQISAQNLVNIAAFMWVGIQYIDSTQVAIDVRAQGGNSQRNQVFQTLQRCIGQNQNVNFHIRFKVPKKFQRVREGRAWYISTQADQIYTEAIQVIYKFYR